MQTETGAARRAPHGDRALGFYLAWQRIREHLRAQWQNFKLIFDGVTSLYIMVPVLLLVVGYSITAWNDPTVLPAWIRNMPLTLLLILLSFVFMGKILLFTEPADLLFLHQRTRSMRLLRLTGIVYSHIIPLLRGGLCTALLLVILRQYELSGAQWLVTLALMIVLTCTSNVCVALCKVHFRSGMLSEVIQFGYRLFFLVLVGISGSYYTVTQIPLLWQTVLLCMVTLIWLTLARYRVKQTHKLMQDIAEDYAQRMAMTKLYLSYYHAQHGITMKQRSKTWLWRRSQRLFSIPWKVLGAQPITRLAGACIKVTLRDFGKLRPYITILTSGVVLLSYSSLSSSDLIVFGALLIPTWMYATGRVSALRSEPGMESLPFDEAQVRSAQGIVLGAFLLPAVIVFGLAMAWIPDFMALRNELMGRIGMPE
jgi:ABC-2 type transport system permease protein